MIDGEGYNAVPAVIALFGGRVLFGQERANIEVLKALKNAGCDITIVMRNEDWDELAAIQNQFENIGFRVLKQPFADPILFRYGWSTIWNTLAGLIIPSLTLTRLTAGRRKPVIYLFNTYYSLTIFAYLLISKAPVVFRAGDLPPMHNHFRRALWRIVRKRTVHAVAVSKYIKRELIALGLPEQKISVVYSRPRHSPATSPETNRNPNGNLPAIVYVGQITEEKGVHELAEAFEYLSVELPCRLIVIGRVDPDWEGDAFARALRDRLKQSTLADRIEFPGYVDDVYTYLRTARVHVQPSVWEEPLANTVMEAKRVGIPSVVFPSGGLPEVVRDGVDGTVCSDKTAASLREALRPYIADLELAQRRGVAARQSLTDLGAERFEQTWSNLIQRAAWNDNRR